jgi:hypothetical protein
MGREALSRKNVALLIAILTGSMVAWLFGPQIVMFLRQEYVPQRKGILMSCGTFVINPGTIEGHYGFSDIPSQIFSYRVGHDDLHRSTESVLSEISQRAEAQGWQVIETGADEIRFGRCFRELRSWAVQDVRIKLAASQGAESLVFVCWTNGDSERPSIRIEDSKSASWVSSSLWPRFDELIREVSAHELQEN